MNYVPLWCKSNYSFLEGASHPEELVQTAHANSLPGLALTDRNGVYGIVRAHEAAKALGQPLLIGSEVTVSPEVRLVLLAQNREGYAQLCALLSQGHHNQTKGSFHLTWTDVAERSSDLIALWQPAHHRRPDHPELASLAEAFAGRLYAAISRHRWLHDPQLERQTLAAAARFQIPPVAVTEVLYHRPERQILQDVLTCIRHGVRLSEAGTKLRPNSEHGIKTLAEIQALYADHPDWIQRTVDIADQCHFNLSELDYRYPTEGVPAGYSTGSWLKKLVWDGARKRYRSQVPAAVTVQLQKELDLIEELQYAGYFLTMWEIVQFCQKQGILCQGRGSAANSAVCYCLEITAIDPVRMNLLFERFLSKERAEPPDIDLDIEHHRREEVIQHMYALYGRDRAAMVANVVRYRSRSALREVGKVLGVPEVDLDRSSKLLAHHEEGLAGGVKDSGLDPTSALYARLISLANQLRGFPRHLSIHPGGFLLGSEPITRIVPIENATMPGRTVIQWDKTDIESMNLFKVDLLGLGALSQLDYAFRLIKQHFRRSLSMATIPANDRGVFDMICQADTVGVFQIESRAQMSMLPRLRPRTYYDLVIEVSLVRPGPITGGMVHPYLRRRSGQEAVTYPHRLLEPVLAKTLGIPLFQEQVMKLAMVAADYSPGEADQLRRDMAAWKQTGRIDQHHDILVSRMTAKGIAPDFAERVFAQIRGFAEYGFPESHAASFALIAYATAWIKHHYPQVFCCALLNAWPMGFYSPSTIIEDAKRHHVDFLAVDIRFSEWDCTLEALPGTSRFGVRIGLRYIKGLVRSEATAVVSERRPTGQLSLADWKARSRASTETWEKLAISGALEGFGIHRRQALWQVLEDRPPAPLEFDDDPAIDFADLSASESILWDYGAMGQSTQGHLLKQVRTELDLQRFKSARAVSSLKHGSTTQTAGLVICRQRPGNAKGVLFLTLEDETGIVNVIVWNQVWQEFRQVILTSSFLAIRGPVQVEQGVVHLIAKKVWTPDVSFDPAQAVVKSHDFH